MIWNDAENFCSQSGAHLASIHSEQEVAFIQSLLGPSWRGQPWIGGQRNGSTFEWIDGSTFDFNNWNPNEPNNFGGQENCIHIYTRNGKWNDIRCNGKLTFVCKRQLGKKWLSF